MSNAEYRASGDGSKEARADLFVRMALLYAAKKIRVIGGHYYKGDRVPDPDCLNSPNGKPSWSAATLDPEKVRRWRGLWLRENSWLAIQIGGETGLACLDLDTKKGKNGFDILPDWQKMSEVIGQTKSGGAHLYYQCAENLYCGDWGDGVETVANLEHGRVPRFNLVYPSEGYTWLKGQLPRDMAKLEQMPPQFWPPAPMGHNRKRQDDELPHIDVLAAAMAVIPNDDLDYNDMGGEKGYKSIMMACYASCKGSEEGFEIFCSWACASVKFNFADTRKDWNNLHGSPPDSIGWGTIERLAFLAKDDWDEVLYSDWNNRSSGPKSTVEKPSNGGVEAPAVQGSLVGSGPASSTVSAPVSPPAAGPNVYQFPPGGAGGGSSVPPPNTGGGGQQAPLPPVHTEEFIAIQLIKQHKDNLKYVMKWGKWYEYNGKVWVELEEDTVFDHARKMSMRWVNTARQQSKRDDMSKARFYRAVESIAKNSPEMLLAASRWDNDLWLLNTPNGVVDLRTGEMREHRINDYMLKMTAVSPDKNCNIFNWKEHLHRAFGWDAEGVEIVDGLQRVLGYGLTGMTTEQMFLFLYGEPATGKSKTIEAVQGIMGDYCVTSAIETFTVQKHNAHPTEIANLLGARFVMSSEIEKGSVFAESRVKQLTGTDKIPARYMRQDWFEFDPQFLIIMYGNYQPRLRGADEGMQRRLHIYPFHNVIPPEDRDSDFARKLKSEWPGILWWMIEGCLKWQQQGLIIPKKVREELREYIDRQDLVSKYIEETYELDPEGRISSRAAYLRYTDWCKANGVAFVMQSGEFFSEFEKKAIKFGMVKKKNLTIDSKSGLSGYVGAKFIDSVQPL